ncbi:hypothetical protein PybrP1_001450 [[Pythium] brassicae (nom. inval.)]|nr:hypothetical protein PybrP1_001450 [[Pythium] brassicae (nom. inval.)]
MRRPSTRARCHLPDCDKYAQTRGLCKAHGGGSRCRDVTCNKLAQSRGLCIAHGGGRRCQHDGCAKLAQSKGYCISHGGGRRCTVPDCEKFSQVKGRCKSHSKLPLTPLSDEVSEALRHQRVRDVAGSPTEVAGLHMRSKLSINFLVNPQHDSDQQRQHGLEADYSATDSDAGSIEDVIAGFQRFSRISPREGEFCGFQHEPEPAALRRVLLPSSYDGKTTTRLPSIASLTT